MKLFKKQGSGFRVRGSMHFAAFVLGSPVVFGLTVQLRVQGCKAFMV